MPDTASIIADACSVAADTHKKVFILFQANWCSWCLKMDSSLNDPADKAYFDKNFVIRHITVYEKNEKALQNTPGAVEFLKQHHADLQGIPAWFIFDSKGKLIADCQMRPAGASLETEGKSVGCPADSNEVDYFIKVLHQTTELSDDQAQMIRFRFRQNDIVETK